MAMTKAEKARVDQLERSVRLAKAMKWPDYGRPAPMTRADIDANMVNGGLRYGDAQRVARGWFYSSHDRGSVSFGCSNGINHDRSGDTTSTQGMGVMFADEQSAWRAARVEMTEKFAEILARIDAEIKRCTT